MEKPILQIHIFLFYSFLFPRKEFLSPTVPWTFYDLQIPSGKAQRMDTKHKWCIILQSSLGKDTHLWEIALRDISSSLTATCFSKSTKSKLLHLWLVRRVATSHIILDAWLQIQYKPFCQALSHSICSVERSGWRRRTFICAKNSWIQASSSVPEQSNKL